MGKFGLWTAICALGLVGTAATARQDVGTITAPAQQKPAKEKKICHDEQVTGSIMGSRRCLTREQWAAIDRDRQASTDQIQGRMTGSGAGVH